MLERLTCLAARDCVSGFKEGELGRIELHRFGLIARCALLGSSAKGEEGRALREIKLGKRLRQRGLFTRRKGALPGRAHIPEGQQT